MTNKLNLKTAIKAALLGGSALLACTQMVAADSLPEKEKSNPLRNPYFGELHLHTKYSLDSYMMGNNNDPDDAYRFAKGDKALPIGNSGVEIKITRPLDFAAVTDHAETIAEYLLCVEGEMVEEGIYNSPTCQQVRVGRPDSDIYKSMGEKIYDPQPTHNEEVCPTKEGEEDSEVCRKASMTMWQMSQKIAEEHYKPHRFTTFIAYEHSPSTPAPNNATFHRNVIFRGTQVPDNVISAYDAYTASDLWKQLDESCDKDKGCEVLVIPHNPNLSSGMYFAKEDRQNHEPDVDGITPPPKPYTLEDYERRERLEPLIEIHQIKGNSECLLGAGTTDEFCQFETIVKPNCGNFDQKSYPDVNCVEDSYVRNGLKKGLTFGESNPFKYGFVGGTDNHNGTPGSTAEFQLVNSSPASATPGLSLYEASPANTFSR